MHWSYVNGVLDFAMDPKNAERIEEDMNAAAQVQKQERRRQREQGLHHRRKELSKAPHAKCSVYQLSLIHI